jgi:hypothetical protein
MGDGVLGDTVTDDDLDEVLGYCRALLDGAEELEAAGGARGVAIDDALRAWRGPLARDFAQRMTVEADDQAAVARLLRDEADAWAEIWADTVNRANRARHAARVEEVAAARSLGEQLVDVFVGDDSPAEVRSFEEVRVPIAATRYAPTGGLERY